MSLTLTLRNPDSAAEGMTTLFSLEGESALIGRSKNCDWNLPDPSNIISSRHAEIRRDGDSYVLKDISTNGTFLNNAPERMAGEHKLADGDVIRIGKYELAVAGTTAAPPPPSTRSSAARSPARPAARSGTPRRRSSGTPRRWPWPASPPTRTTSPTWSAPPCRRR